MSEGNKKSSKGKKLHPMIQAAAITASGAVLVAIIGLFSGFIGGAPPPETPVVLTPTSTITPTPTITSTPTLTPTFTPIPTLTPPLPGDFEIDEEGWGDKPSGVKLITDAVKQQCETVSQFSYSGLCWLQYIPTRITNKNAYLARRGTEADTQSKITIQVKVPEDAELCTDTACSTAKIIVWDRNYVSHELPREVYVELNNPGTWAEVSYDLSSTAIASPYQFIGVHFYIVTDYQGPFYIDAVNIPKQ